MLIICWNWKKIDFVDRYQEIVFCAFIFSIYLNYILFFFLILISWTVVNFILAKFGHQKVWPSSKVYILKILWYCPSVKVNVCDEMKKMMFLSALWMLKRSNTLSLIYVEENEPPLVFWKLKLNSHNVGYLIRDRSLC